MLTAARLEEDEGRGVVVSVLLVDGCARTLIATSSSDHAVARGALQSLDGWFAKAREEVRALGTTAGSPINASPRLRSYGGFEGGFGQ
jgi:hypothetical protein